MKIYTLLLESNKYYVGKTNNPDLRLNDHFNDAGAEWTKKYKPIKVITIQEQIDNFDEDRTTIRAMQTYSIDNVRGGSFCNPVLSKQEKDIINKMINSAENRCFKCGSTMHYISECPHADTPNKPSKQPANGKPDTCAKCGRYGHLDTSCYAKTKLDGTDIPKPKYSKYYAKQANDTIQSDPKINPVPDGKPEPVIDNADVPKPKYNKYDKYSKYHAKPKSEPKIEPINPDIIVEPTNKTIPKIKPIDQIYELYGQGKTVDEIAQMMKYQPITIEEHIIRMYELDFVIDLTKVGFNDDIYKLVSNKIISFSHSQKLRVIKDALPKNISYLMIKLTIAKMKKDGIYKVGGLVIEPANVPGEDPLIDVNFGSGYSIIDPMLEPVSGTVLEPVSGPVLDPVEPAYLDPVGPAYLDPVGPSYLEPVESSYLEPVGPAYLDPVGPSYLDPVGPAYLEPLDESDFELLDAPYLDPSNNPINIQSTDLSNEPNIGQVIDHVIGHVEPALDNMVNRVGNMFTSFFNK